MSTRNVIGLMRIARLEAAIKAHVAQTEYSMGLVQRELDSLKALLDDDLAVAKAAVAEAKRRARA